MDDNFFENNHGIISTINRLVSFLLEMTKKEKKKKKRERKRYKKEY